MTSINCSNHWSDSVGGIETPDLVHTLQASTLNQFSHRVWSVAGVTRPCLWHHYHFPTPGKEGKQSNQTSHSGCLMHMNTEGKSIVKCFKLQHPGVMRVSSESLASRLTCRLGSVMNEVPSGVHPVINHHALLSTPVGRVQGRGGVSSPLARQNWLNW